MSEATMTRKPKTNHADLAVKMVGRLPAEARAAFCARHGWGGIALSPKRASELTGIGPQKVNELYRQAQEMIAVAIDSDEVTADDVPLLVSIGLMRCDEIPEFDLATERRLLDAPETIDLTRPTPEEVASEIQGAVHEVAADVVADVAGGPSGPATARPVAGTEGIGLQGTVGA